MEAFIFLIPLTLIIVFGMLLAFFWCLKNKQYEDLDGAASRILFDDALRKDVAKKPENE